MTKNELKNRLANVPVVEPDETDLAMLAEVEKEKDDEVVTFQEIKDARACSGVLSIRIPKELHRIIAMHAEENGTSINQYVMYCLTKTNSSAP